MTINAEALLAWDIPEVRQTITRRDAMLYALGVGYGSDPCDDRELPFVYEEQLLVPPTLAVTLGYPGQWHAMPGTGITSSHVVQGSQWFRITSPLTAPLEVIGKPRVTAVHDKGRGSGALVTVECTVYDASNSGVLCTLGTIHYCRADGGFGGAPPPRSQVEPMPERAADAVRDLHTSRQAALLYRLSGDYNPLHADPARARRAGYERPILHGRCTLGIAGRALVRTVCDYAPAKLTAMQARFVSPVYPGDTIRTEMWRNGSSVRFRATVPQRGAIVLNYGTAECT
jgi:acyl dehydratase